MPDQTIILPKAPREALIARISRVLGALPVDRVYSVTVAEVKRKRSCQQNKYLFGVVYPTILKHLEGWTAEDVHEWCLGEHFGWETLEGLGRKRVKPIRRSSKLSVTEFMDYIADIQQRMAERGILIPDANEGEWQ